ncbi:MAG: hypothetical protein AB1611_03360 [bacterium]
MCERQHCIYREVCCKETEEGDMKHINQEFAVNHLYRIFVYGKGKSRDHDLSVRGFQDFLHQKGIEYSIRALYDMAEGKVPFPAALLPYLIEFSKDQQLISMFLPSIKMVVSEISLRLQTEEQELKKKMEGIKQAKSDLDLRDFEA